MYIDTMNQCLDEIKALFVDWNTFDQSHCNLQQVVACKVIGDDITYSKFLTKQINSKDHDAMSLHNSLKQFAALKNCIGKLSEALRLCGFLRIAGIINFVTSSVVITHKSGNFWSICALTGKSSNKTSIWKASNEQVIVDIRYEPFLVAIWMLFHIEDIEASETLHYLHTNYASVSQLTMRDSIQQYLTSVRATNDQEDLYWRAFQVIVTTIEMTIETIQHDA
jgi:hypothetical protein